jgi:hypothetical protein
VVNKNAQAVIQLNGANATMIPDDFRGGEYRYLVLVANYAQ